LLERVGCVAEKGTVASRRLQTQAGLFALST